MVLDLQVGTHDPLSARLTTAVERALSPSTRSPPDGSAFFSESFIGRHTEFESFAGFCRACPSDRDTVGGVQRLPVDERDEFVAATTEFETWSEMKRTAALTDALTLQSV